VLFATSIAAFSFLQASFTQPQFDLGHEPVIDSDMNPGFASGASSPHHANANRGFAAWLDVPNNVEMLAQLPSRSDGVPSAMELKYLEPSAVFVTRSGYADTRS
jgi:hypothetical protein